MMEELDLPSHLKQLTRKKYIYKTTFRYWTGSTVLWYLEKKEYNKRSLKIVFIYCLEAVSWPQHMEGESKENPLV